jgi:hypothetical protein
MHQARHGFDVRQAFISTCDYAKKTQGVILAMSCKALVWTAPSRQKTPDAFPEEEMPSAPRSKV